MNIIGPELMRKIDTIRYNRLLTLKDSEVKDFFNKEGCGLEIEFGVNYERRCRDYIENGLKKLKGIVGNDGKFVEDSSIGCDMNYEIVLNPLSKQALYEKLCAIKSVLNHYENFVYTENCGVHATFLANEAQKRKLYEALVSGAYKSEMFVHSKYKPDLMSIALKEDGGLMSFDEYMNYQKTIGHKYVSVNFLKDNLVEFRSLDLEWENIEYVIDLTEKITAKEK